MTDAFGDLSFAANPDPRCPVVLVLDVSGSMAEVRPGEAESPIDALNKGLDTLARELAADTLASRRVEVAIVTAGGDVTVVSDFATVDQLVIPQLVASGPTPLGTALIRALDMLDDRKRTYRANGVSYYRPWVVVITDGVPTDDIGPAAERITAAEDSKSLALFAVGVEGADLGVLGRLSLRRTPLKLKGMNFSELFIWLSASQARVSASQVGETVAVPSPAGWAEV